jgi:hypothetical protein
MSDREERIIVPAFKDAARYDWDIERPIEIVPMPHEVAQHTDAYHVWRTADSVHELAFRPKMHPRWLLESMAHELRHAWQSELWECPVSWGKAYSSERESFEQDARLAEKSRWHELLHAVELSNLIVRARLEALIPDERRTI